MTKEVNKDLEQLAESCFGMDQEYIDLVNLSAQRLIVQYDPEITQAEALKLYRRYEGFRDAYKKRKEL